MAGLTVEEIARAFLASPRTLEQRITRAKRKIRDERVPYEVPSPKELPDRLESVLAAIHLIFNEGYSASVDAPIIRHELCRLAIGQAHLLHRLFPAEPEVEGPRTAGPEAGLELLDALAAEPGIPDRHAFHSLRAGLLEESGRLEEAALAYRDACDRTVNTSEIEYFREKIRQLEKSSYSAVGCCGRASSSR